MADPIVEIIKAEVRPGFEYKPVQVAGKAGVYQSHRWVRQNVPDVNKDRTQAENLYSEAKKYLREQMLPRRMQLRAEWQGWIQHKARVRAEFERFQAQKMVADPQRKAEYEQQLKEAIQLEKQYGKIYRQYRLEHIDYGRYVKELEKKLKGNEPAPPEEQQGALFPKEELTGKPPEPEKPSTSHYKHQFDSSPEITTNLAEGDIVSRKYIGGGCNGAYKIRLADGTVACMKMQFDEERGLRHDIPQGGYSKREACAYEISEAIGWHLVPPTTVREDDFGDIGSVQLWNDEAKLPGYYHASEDQKWKMAIFDLIIGNEDRHDHNYLIAEDGRVIAIDNGLTLGESGKPSCYRNKFAEKIGEETRIPATYITQVKNVDWDAVTEHVKTHVSPESARHMRARVDYLLEKQELFDISYNSGWRKWREAHGDQDNLEAMEK